MATFVANTVRIAALNLQSTLPRQYARKYRYSERTGTVSQTKSDSEESTQIDEVDEKSDEDYLYAQALNKTRFEKLQFSIKTLNDNKIKIVTVWLQRRAPESSKSSIANHTLINVLAKR